MNKPSAIAAPAAEVPAKYLKILGSGEIVQWNHFSEISQLYGVESASGRAFSIQSNKVSRQVTAAEAAEFTRQRAGSIGTSV